MASDGRRLSQQCVRELIPPELLGAHQSAENVPAFRLNVEEQPSQLVIVHQGTA